MASTFVRYQGQVVQVPESIITILGYMLFYEAAMSAKTASDKTRFEQMFQDFGNRTIGVGCTDLGLDQLLQGDSDKEQEFLTFVRLARERIAGLGGSLPAAYVDQFMPIPDYRGQAIISPWLLKVLEVIDGLIRGEKILPLTLYEGPNRVIS